jgi:hypothetical protein
MILIQRSAFQMVLNARENEPLADQLNSPTSHELTLN